MKEFFTIKNDIQSEIVIKKSKFIANLIKINSKEDAETKIKEIKKKYFDARHNCIAYRVLENEKIIERFSDDGEPSGTAGQPELPGGSNHLCYVQRERIQRDVHLAGAERRQTGDPPCKPGGLLGSDPGRGTPDPGDHGNLGGLSGGARVLRRAGHHHGGGFLPWIFLPLYPGVRLVNLPGRYGNFDSVRNAHL